MKYNFDPNDFDMEKIIKIKDELHLETSTFLTITNACEDALAYSSMIGILGDTGNGKTNALKYFSRNRSNVYYVRGLKSMTAKSFFLHIMEVLGIRNRYTDANLYNLIRSIGYYLNSFESNVLLVLDEAGRLSDSILMHCHDLRNETNENVGISFASPHYLKLSLEKLIKANVRGIPELYGRFELWIEVEAPLVDEQAQYCIHRGIKNRALIEALVFENQSFRSLVSKVRNFGKKAIRYKKRSQDVPEG